MSIEASFSALLVGENSADTEFISRWLGDSSPAGEEGVRLLHAGAAREACTILEGGAVDVVIFAVHLPHSQFLHALRLVRSAAPEVPVVVFTQAGNPDFAVDSLRAGAQDYVMKPPSGGAGLRRILRYARERQALLQQRDTAVQGLSVAATHWRLLAEVGSLLYQADTPTRVFGEVARCVVPEVADALVILWVGDDGESPGMAEALHADERRLRDLRSAASRLIRRDSTAEPGLQRALAGYAAADPECETAFDELVGSLGLERPQRHVLGARGRLWGLLVIEPPSTGRDLAVDEEFGVHLAHRLAAAIEREHLFRQLEHAIAGRDRAFGIVSHDLCNPIGTIRICAQALLDPEPPSLAGLREMARIIDGSAAWMQHIVADLLDRASLDAGQLTLSLRPTLISDVLETASMMIAPSAAEAGLDLDVTYETGLPSVTADPRRLLQILVNLLGNAVKFTPAGGRITLRAESTVPADGGASAPTGSGVHPGVSFTVSDTGPGISPEDLAHVFDWFWQSRRGHGGGAGLGLAIAQGLVEAHQSRLYVRTAPDQGSTFWFAIAAATSSTQSQGDPYAHA